MGLRSCYDFSGPHGYYAAADLYQDNLVKFVLDALNEKLYKDDRQICEITARKVYRVSAYHDTAPRLRSYA
eukprot:2244994-Rhodomonas_salina.2